MSSDIVFCTNKKEKNSKSIRNEEYSAPNTKKKRSSDNFRHAIDSTIKSTEIVGIY